MIRIAVIDDVTAVCGQLEKYLFHIANKYDVTVEVETYRNGEEFCSDLNSGEIFDLIFLDIELKALSGIEVSRYIRDAMGDELQQIVFISAKKQYSLELHSFHPLDFLVKDIRENDVETVFKRFLKIDEIRNDVFEFKVGHDIRRVKIQDIKYLTINNRIVSVVLKNGNTVEFYGTLEKIYIGQLKKFNFLFLHKKYIVNPIFIEIYEYDKVVLNDGTVIPIGSSRRKEIRAWQAENSGRGL